MAHLYNRTILLIVISCCTSFCCEGQSKIYINPNGYTSTYSVGEQSPVAIKGPFISGKDTFTSQANAVYFINTGTTIGACGITMNSYIYFNTDSNGKIIPGTLCPSSSASLSAGNTIIFKTSPITIDRGKFSGELYASFELQSNTKIKPLPNSQLLHYSLVKGLTYYLYCGGSGLINTTHTCCVDPGDPIQSGFYFTIDSNGSIKLLNSSALQNPTDAVTLKDNGKTMALNTSKITIEDSRYHSVNHQYRVCGYPAFNLPSGGTKSFDVVNSILSFVIWYDSSGERIYYFQPY